MRSSTDIASISNEIECGGFIEDYENVYSCGTDALTAFWPFTNTSLEGICDGVQISWREIFCYQLHPTLLIPLYLTQFTLVDIEIDWESLTQDCPDLPLPSGLVEQSEFLEDIRKELLETLEYERLKVNMEKFPIIYYCGDNAFVTNVSRIEGACYTYCEVVDFSPNESKPLKVKKFKCGGKKCCERKRQYCYDGDLGGPRIRSEEIITLSDNCVSTDTPCLNPISAECDRSCESLFY